MHLTRSASAGAEIRCPCGEGRCVNLRTEVSPHSMEHYVSELRERRARSPVPAHSPTTELCERVLTFRCPWCEQVFNGFDACAALRCDRCHQFFCGLCMVRCTDSQDAHARVLVCAQNPTEPRSYFIPQEHVATVHAREARSRLFRALASISESDGYLAMLGLSLGVRRLRSDVMSACDVLVLAARPGALLTLKWCCLLLLGAVCGGAFAGR